MKLHADIFAIKCKKKYIIKSVGFLRLLEVINVKFKASLFMLK